VTVLAKRALVPPLVSGAIRDQILEYVRQLQLSEVSEASLIKALSGSTRVLPEGKATPCSAMSYLAYVSAGGKSSDEVVPVAAAMEMLMAAYDVIDDIQDDEEPLPSDRHAFGELFEAVSILMLAAHAQIVKSTEAGVDPVRVLTCIKMFDEMGIQSWKGQILDMRMESQADVTIEESLEATSLKSASLIKLAAQLGAAIVTDDPELIDLYGQYGWHVGIVTQLMNDAEGLWPRGRNKSDLRLRKKTIPIVYALSLVDESNMHAQTIQKLFHSSDSTSTISEEDLKLALWKSGAFHYTWMLAAREKAKAERVGNLLSGERFSDWPLARLLE
jgi:competence protein ComQ